MAVAASNARLGEIFGYGYLALRTEGYRRIEGVFFLSAEHRRAMLDLLATKRTILYRGRLHEGQSVGDAAIPVLVTAVHDEDARLRLNLMAPAAPVARR